MHPEWRPVSGFESAYLVSSEGQVKSVARGAGRVPERLLKQFADRGGYMKLVLCHNGQRANVYTHRLVAEAFLPNPEGLAHVNHIDGAKDNNCRDNLEWTSSTENNIHACRVLLKRVRPVVAESTTGPVSLCYPSIRQALEDGFHRGSIQRCIEGRRRRHGGYRWHDCTPMKA